MGVWGEAKNWERKFGKIKTFKGKRGKVKIREWNVFVGKILIRNEKRKSKWKWDECYGSII